MAVFRVSSPVPGYTDRVGAVDFVDGVALIDDETDAATLKYCRGAGYGVVEVADEPLVDEVVEVEQPKKSASTEVWRTWAVEHGGMSAEDAEELSRDQLVEWFTTSTEETPA